MLDWIDGRPRALIRRWLPKPVRDVLWKAACAVEGSSPSDINQTVNTLIDQALEHLADKNPAAADKVLSEAEKMLPTSEPGINYIFETYYRIDKGEPMDPRVAVISRLNHARILIDQGKAPIDSSDNLAFWTWYDGYLRDQRAISPKKVTPYGHHTHSVSNDDGIIQEIFKRIGTTNKYFVEFGVNTGEQCNTTALLYHGWRGLWLEAANCYYVMAKHIFRNFVADGRLNVVNRFITAENINEAISENIHPDADEEIDLLSVDVDGNDYWIWKAIACVRPRVLVIEYNSYFNPPISKVQSYDPVKIYGGTSYYGASLQAINDLCEQRGYKLVACSLVGDNAFYVRADLCGDKFYEPGNAEAHYEPMRAIGFPVGHYPGSGDWDIDPLNAKT